MCLFKYTYVCVYVGYYEPNLFELMCWVSSKSSFELNNALYLMACIKGTLTCFTMQNIFLLHY